MRYRPFLTVVPLSVIVALSGCSSGDSGSDRSSSSSAPSSSEVTIDGTPQSQWSTRAPAPTTSSPSSASSSVAGGAPTSLPKAGQTATTFVTDFVHTDGVTQQQWATKVTANATATFGGRLAAQGLERLPHGVKVTGKAQQLWISDQEPTGAWYVPTSNGGYTALMDLTTPAGKVTDLTPGKGDDATTATEPQD